VIKFTKKDILEKKVTGVSKPSQAMFNVFAIAESQILGSVPCNVPEALIPDLDSSNIKLC